MFKVSTDLLSLQGLMPWPQYLVEKKYIVNLFTEPWRCLLPSELSARAPLLAIWLPATPKGYADDTTLVAENEAGLKSLLMRVKEESEKAGLKLSIQRMKMASSPITSWQIVGEAMETVRNFISLGSKIIVDGDCSHEIKGCLLLGKKAMINLDSMLKSRDVILLTKVRLVKAMVFPLIMYGWESWTVNKAECGRIDTFEMWCWRRLLRVPWTAGRSNQSILREINAEYSLEGLMLKVKLQYFGDLMRTVDSLEKTLVLGKIEGRWRRG